MRDIVKVAIIGGGATIVAALISAAVQLYDVKHPSKNSHSPENYNRIETISDNTNSQNIDSNIGKLDGSIQSNSEERLMEIFIGMSKSYSENIFGIPQVELEHEFDDSVELDYVFNRFFLQLIFDESDSLKFYSVVSRDENFRPCIPKLQKCLGDNTFSEMSGFYNPPTYIYSYLSSKHYGYGEYLYLGNPGNYHNYYLGFNSLGTDYGETYPYVKSLDEGKGWEEFRANNKPNSYGVGDIPINEYDLEYEIGPEFYTFRNMQY